MKIAFKGIQDIKVLKKIKENNGFIETKIGQNIPAKETINTVKIKCKLTNDTNDNHFSEYLKILDKTYRNTKMDLKNESDFGIIELVTQYRVLEALDKKFKSVNLFLNDKNIELNNDGLLALYTYIAKLTREMTNSDIANNAQKDYIKWVNKKIHNEAIKYLDITS